LRPRPNNPISSVSLSVTNIVGSPLNWSVYRPMSECSATTRVHPCAVDAMSAGRRASRPHDQVFRNHSCGNRCSGFASGPWLVAVISTQMSSGAALA
jgi:hypothetical protein